MNLPAILVGLAVILAATYASGTNLVMNADILNLPPKVKQVDVSVLDMPPGGGSVTVEAVLSDQNSLADLVTKECRVAHQSDIAATLEGTVWHSTVNLQPSSPSLNENQSIEAEYNCTFGISALDDRGSYVVLARAVDHAGAEDRWLRVINFASISETLWVPDADGDGYTLKTGAVISDSSPGQGFRRLSESIGTDCYDKNAEAFPGQAKSFQVNRGDGSFDYDCDGMQEKAIEGTSKSCLNVGPGTTAWCTAGTNTPGCGAKGLATNGPMPPLGWCFCAPAVQTCR